MRQGFWMRCLALGIDSFLAIVLAHLLRSSTGHFFSARAALTLQIGSPHTIWKGPIPMILGVFGSFVYGLPFALLVILFVEPIFGASPGKWMMHLCIRDGSGNIPQVRQIWTRWLLKSGGILGIVLALLLGVWQLLVVSLAVTVGVGLGYFLVLGPRRQALHDRCAHTAVFRY